MSQLGDPLTTTPGVRVFDFATGQSVDDIMNWERDIATVTVDDVNKAARTAFEARASVTGVLLPEAKVQ